MKTRGISRLAALMLKRKQNNFNTRCKRKYVCNVIFENQSKEPQDKKLHYFIAKLMSKGRIPIEWSLW